jgi:4-hydroxy-3-methylbut-2-enyl diphosphate reductase
VCKETNPNTIFISEVNELYSASFSKGENVGICGATSTPMWLMEQVKDELLKL